MFGLFSKRPVCPVDCVVKEWIDQRWSWLESQFGRDHVRSKPVILPTDEFFPDEFFGDTEDLELFLDRIAGYMDLRRDQLVLHFYSQDRSGHTGVYNAAGLYYGKNDDGQFVVAIDVSSLADPTSAVATLAHELGHVHLLGHDRITSDEPDHELLTDLITVYFGLGIFNANSVIRDFSWSDGQYSGWWIRRLGYLNMEHYGYALAKYALMRDDDGEPWSQHLRPDVRKLFKQALHFLKHDSPPPAPEPHGHEDHSKLRLLKLSREQGLDRERLHFVYDAMNRRFEYLDAINKEVLHAKAFQSVVHRFAVDMFDRDAVATLTAWGLVTGHDLGVTVGHLKRAGLLAEEPEEFVTPFDTLGPIFPAGQPAIGNEEDEVFDEEDGE